MQRTTPESVFAIAQEAMERGDWETFFECLDRRDLLRLAGMGVAVTGEVGQTFSTLCLEHGIPAEALERVKTFAQGISESARAMLRGHAEEQIASATQNDMLEQSLRHRDLVRAHEKAIEACLKSVTNLAAFTAAAERLKRAVFGGGSVSSTLFVGESLRDITVDGQKASGVRRMKGGWEEAIAFVQKKGQWYVKLLPRARSWPK